MEAHGAQSGFRYSAFISYSHKDSAWASWLHKSLESYTVPRQLRNRSVVNQSTGRLKPVFRDREELSSGPNLHSAIRESLSNSEYLIVICSPRSASSKYVAEEIQFFCADRDPAKVVALIVDGEPYASRGPNKTEECFPAHFLNYGTETLASDARPIGDGKFIAKFKVLAALLQISLGELRNRDALRVRRLVIHRSVLSCALLLALTLAVVFGADAGLELPGGEKMRLLLDRHRASLFRPIGDTETTQAVKASSSQNLTRSILAAQLKEGRFSYDVNGPESHHETWTSAVCLAALTRSPEFSSQDGQSMLKCLDRVFSSELLPSFDSRSGGWEHRDGGPKMAPTVFWFIAALATAQQRNDVFSEAERIKLNEYFHKVVQLSYNFRAPSTGGWHMFAEEIGDNPCTYASVLALQALIETERANLQWDGSSERVRELMQQTANWLLSSYDTSLVVPGWRRNPTDHHKAGFDGLTLQVYATLLQAERLQAIELTPELIQYAQLHVESCWKRDFRFPIGSAEFEGVLDRNGQLVSVNESVGFLWLPWAIETARQLKDRHHRVPLKLEHLTRLERVYNYAVAITDNHDAKQDQRVFSLAEMLFCLCHKP